MKICNNLWLSLITRVCNKFKYVTRRMDPDFVVHKATFSLLALSYEVSVLIFYLFFLGEWMKGVK